MMPRNFATLLVVAAVATACGRAEFGTTSTDESVVDSDVERESPGGAANDGNNATDDDVSEEFNGGTDANNTAGDPSAPAQPDAGRGHTGDFSFASYQAVASAGRNAVLSPHGLARSLIVAQAASGKATAAQIAATLEPYLGANTYSAFNAADLQYEDRQKAGTFEMIGAVWADESTAVEQSFVDDLARYTGLELRLIDFAASPEDARNTINNWYSTRTEGRVSEVVGPRAVDDTTRFLVTDSTWFAAPWGFAGFDPAQTTYANFEGSESDVQVPMMRTQDTLLHLEAPDFQGVVLPLEGGFTFVAIVPDDLDAFDALLSAGFLDRLIGEATPTPVDLRFPRIEVSDRVRLTDVAETLGLQMLIDGTEPLAGFADDTMLGDAHQRVRVSFDEIGVAVEDAAMDPGDDSPPAENDIVELAFERPFFFAVRDGETERYFLLGRVAQP